MVTTEPKSNERLPLALALITGLVLLQLLPELGLVDFHREEARRVVPAREMLASGNFISPTIWGQAYLSKPPGYFWLLSLVFKLTGSISEYAARLPSVLASLATALSITLVGARLFSVRAGFFGAMLFTLSLETLGKGRLAEIEPTLTFFVFAAGALWWFGRAGSWLFSLLAGVALAGALLCKGPAALLYFACPPMALALTQRAPRFICSARFFVPLLLGTGLAALWVVALFEQVGRAEALAHWGSQVSGQGGHSFAAYLVVRSKYVAGTLLAFFPASFIVLLALRTPAWRELRARPEVSFAFWATAAGWLFFLVFPGTSVRYAYPGLPFMALLAGHMLEVGVERGRSALLTRRLQRLASGSALLAVVLGLVCVVGFFTPLDEVRIDLGGLVLGLACSLLGLKLYRDAGGERRLLVALLVLPILFGQLVRSQVGAATALRHSRKPIAAQLDASLPAGAALHVGFWDNFNTLLYVDHEVRYTPRWSELDEEAWLLLKSEQEAELEPAPWPYELLRRQQFWGGERVLLHVRPEGP